VAVRVVIAEDEAIARLDLKEMLEEEGYQVVGEAASGEEAVELAGRLAPDLVILDVKMPGMDGIEAARRISASRRSAVLMLTAFSQRDLVGQARDAGALAYLVKPFQRSELVPAIEVALGRFGEIRALAGENAGLAAANASLSRRLEARQLLDRAKGVLMDEVGMKEREAFSFIQRRAMQTRTTMAEVARAVIEGSLRP
jgi:AmiR/NasT family two-component response regulator